MQDVPLTIALVVHVYMCMLHAASKTKSGQTLKAWPRWMFQILFWDIRKHCNIFM